IALVREFVRDNLTSKGMVADWVYHDKDGNPHIHLMTTLRPLTQEGFGRKKVAVTGLHSLLSDRVQRGVLGCRSRQFAVYKRKLVGISMCRT
ncbi:hypothetical protein E0I94_31305, partial [Rhizobium laguerreae]